MLHGFHILLFKPRTTVSEYLSQLSDVQRAAVTQYEGPSLVIAGAGSGKTRVLTYRIAHMIDRGVDPRHILALTFTNKAAREMRERISAIVPPQASRAIWMGTFHSVFSRMLRSEAERLGFPSSFTIYETSDSHNLVKEIIKEMNLSDEKYKPKEIFSRISLLKNNLTTPQIYCNNASMTADDVKAGRGEFGNIYRAYMARCKQNGAMDFDDLLLYTNILLRDHPDVLAKFQEQFRYILVDEYQDTNFAQYLIIKKLSERNRNICVVGDDAQSIYSFRGAKIENILRFQKDYPSAAVHKLEENYRSTQTIVNAANSVISKNSAQLKKKVFSRKEVGEKVVLNRAYTEKEEAIAISRDIAVRHDMGTPLKNMAILYRTNAQSRALEEALRVRGIGYKIYGGLSFYQRAEIKHVIAYVRLIVNHRDDEALKRIINVPARGIGNTTIGKIAEYSAANGLSMWETITKFTPEQMGIRGVAVKKLSGFIETIRELQQSVDEKDAYEFVYEVARRSGLIALYQDNPAPESQSAYQNIEELVNSLKQQTELALKEEGAPLMTKKWIEEVTLLTDMDNEQGVGEDKVTLMTIHASKGLEYDCIYLAGVEEGIFPSPRSTESSVDLEEERRLFYVALTRAIKRIMISFSLSRFKWGSVTNSTPSRFIKEIDREYLDEPELLDNPFSAETEEEEEEPRTAFGKRFGNASYGKRPNRFTPKEGTPRRPAAPPQGNFRRMEPTAAPRPKEEETGRRLEAGDLSVGCRVSHDRFGKGTVEAFEEFAGDIKASIKFDSGENKVLLLKFAKLKRIS